MGAALEYVYDMLVMLSTKANEARNKALDQDTWTDRQRSLSRVINGTNYDFAFSLLVAYNLLIITAQTDMEVRGEDVAWWVELSNVLLLLFYIFDCSVRVYVYRIAYFLEVMNLFDFVVVSLDSIFFLLDLILVSGMVSVSFLRIARLCRMRRLLKLFPTLHKLGKSILQACTSISWSLLIFALILTCWSVIAVQWIHPLNLEVAARGWYDGCIDCSGAFSSVMRSNLTFFQQILTGDSWGQVSKPIIIEFPESAIFFLGVWVTVGLALTNIILAAIVEAASEARADEEANHAAAMRQEKYEAQQGLLKMCQEMDEDGSGNLTEKEIMRGARSDGDFAMLMLRLDIEESDISMIFEMLDADGSGEVSYEELVSALVRMKNGDFKTMLHFLKFYVEDVNKKVALGLNAVQQKIIAEFERPPVKNGMQAADGVQTADLSKPLEESHQTGVSEEAVSSSTDFADEILAVKKKLEAAKWTELQASLDGLREILADASFSGLLVNDITAGAKDTSQLKEGQKEIESNSPPQPSLPSDMPWRPEDFQVETPQRPLSNGDDGSLRPAAIPAAASRYAAVTAFIQERKSPVAKKAAKSQGSTALQSSV